MQLYQHKINREIYSEELNLTSFVLLLFCHHANANKMQTSTMSVRRLGDDGPV